MFPNISGKPTDLTCTEQAFPEFPELLFGNSPDNGDMYFDATEYLKSKDLSIKVTDFFDQCKNQIKSLQQSYLIKEKDICKINRKGNFLIDSNFVYLFISFVEPDFLAYLNDRIHELFNSGYCISDSNLLRMAQERLDESSLKAIENERNKT
jgi:hypothetical protein